MLQIFMLLYCASQLENFGRRKQYITVYTYRFMIHAYTLIMKIIATWTNIYSLLDRLSTQRMYKHLLSRENRHVYISMISKEIFLKNMIFSFFIMVSSIFLRKPAQFRFLAILAQLNFCSFSRTLKKEYLLLKKIHYRATYEMFGKNVGRISS